MAWESLNDTQYAVGRLITPEWVYTHMERDWALFAAPMDFYHPVTNITVPASNIHMKVVFPDSWALDTTLDAAAELRMSIWFQLHVDTGSATLAFTTNSVTGSGTITATSPTWVNCVRYWTGTLPTGQNTVSLSCSPAGGATATVQRAYGSGADSMFYFTFV